MVKRRGIVSGYDPEYINPDTSIGRPKGVQSAADMRLSVTFDIFDAGVFAEHGSPDITGTNTNQITIAPFMAAIPAPGGGFYTVAIDQPEAIELDLSRPGIARIYVQQQDYYREQSNDETESEVVIGVTYENTSAPAGSILLSTVTINDQTNTNAITFPRAYWYTGRIGQAISIPTAADIPWIRLGLPAGSRAIALNGDGEFVKQPNDDWVKVELPVTDVMAGANVAIDKTNPRKPVVRAIHPTDTVTEVVGGSSVTVNNANPRKPVVNVTHPTNTLTGITAGSNITIDNTNPRNPKISAAGGGSGGGAGTEWEYIGTYEVLAGSNDFVIDLTSVDLDAYESIKLSTYNMSFSVQSIAGLSIVKNGNPYNWEDYNVVIRDIKDDGTVTATALTSQTAFMLQPGTGTEQAMLETHLDVVMSNVSQYIEATAKGYYSFFSPFDPEFDTIHREYVGNGTTGDIETINIRLSTGQLSSGTKFSIYGRK